MTTLYQLLDELRTPEHTLFEKLKASEGTDNFTNSCKTTS